MEDFENQNDCEVLEDSPETNLSMEEPSDIYKVEFWDEDEEEPTGYKIKGKFLFGKAVEMLKLRLKKSKISKKIGDHKYYVTDVRTTKHGSEIDIEVEDNEKGGACVKIFGPNKKNEYTVVINKMKKFSQKYVKIVATEIILKIIDQFILTIQKESSQQSKRTEFNFVCTDCGKRFVSDRNLKIHTAKSHIQDKGKKILKRKQIYGSKAKESQTDLISKKINNKLKSTNKKSRDESPMDVDIVIGGENPTVQGHDGEILQIDIVQIIKELANLRKPNELNETVMGNLIKKVDILEQTIENFTQKDFKNGETKDMPNIGASEKSDDEGDWNCVKYSNRMRSGDFQNI